MRINDMKKRFKNERRNENVIQINAHKGADKTNRASERPSKQGNERGNVARDGWKID